LKVMFTYTALFERAKSNRKAQLLHLLSTTSVVVRQIQRAEGRIKMRECYIYNFNLILMYLSV